MLLNFKELEPLEIYRSMIQTIIPRPVAWILSENETGSFNLAPFSFFNAVCSNPPMVMVSIGKKRDGTLKDTRSNLLRTKDCVIHIAAATDAKAVTASSLPYEYGESEVELGDHQVTLDPSFGRLPKLKGAKVAMACTLERQLEIGPRKQGLILLCIDSLHIDDSLVSSKDGSLIVDAMGLNPLARLGGDDYGTLGQVMTVDRPPYEP